MFFSSLLGNEMQLKCGYDVCVIHIFLSAFYVAFFYEMPQLAGYEM